MSDQYIKRISCYSSLAVYIRCRVSLIRVDTR